MSNFVTDFLKKDNSINENNHNGNIEEMLQPEKGIVEDVNSHQLGFMDASKSLGNLTGFDYGIDKVYQDHLNQFSQSKEKSESEKLELQNSIKSSEEKIEKLQEVKTRIKDIEIPEEKNKISIYKKERIEAKNSAKIRDPRAGLWVDVLFIGSLLIGGLAFLWVFYSSVVYNALFLEIDPEKDSFLIQSIFNPKAFEEAFSKGNSTAILIVTAGAIFLIFGLYPHTYTENKKTKLLKKLLYGFAFLADAVLAYEITHKLYEAKRAFSFNELPPFTLSIAVTEMNFWIIIILGFFVYLFWTLMYESWKNNLNRLFGFDNVVLKFNSLIEASEEKIQQLMNKLDDLQNEIDEINKIIAMKRKEFNTPKINTHDLLGKLLGYSKGWIVFLKNSQAPVNDIHQLSDKFQDFLKSKNIQNAGVLLDV